MQPTKISLENFLSYGKEDIDLTGINIAALIGENGAGKSSLLDSLTWALYGEGRYKDIDHYIRQGQEQATNELQFLLNSELYRIIRGRSNKGRGKSTLELAKMNGADWIPLSGTTIRETEQMIRDLLRMDYDTFVSSCFILQGQSDRLCSAGPTERKKILAQILGLDIYEKLQEAAKARVKEHKEKAAIIKAKIEGLDVELTGKADIRSQEETLRDNLREIEQQIFNMQIDLEELEKKKGELQFKFSKLDDLRERKSALDREIQEINTFLAGVAEKEKDAGKREEFEKQLASISDEIISLESELKTAEADLTKWQVQAGRYDDIQNTVQRLDREIRQSETQLQTLEEKRKRLQQIVDRKEQIRAKGKELDQVKADLAEMDSKAIQERELQQKLNGAEKALTEWKNHNEKQILQLDSQRKEAQKKMAILDQVNCDRADCLFLKDAFQASELFSQCSNKIAELVSFKPPEALKNAYSEASERVRTLGYDQQQHQELRTQAQDLEKWAKLVPELDQAESSLIEIEAQGRELQEAVKEKQTEKTLAETDLVTVENARTQVISFETVIKQTKQKISDLRGKEQEIRTELGKAQAAEEHMKELLAQAEEKRNDRKQKNDQVFTLSLEIDDIAGLSSQIETLAGDISSSKTKLTEAREEEQQSRVELGKVEQRLADLEQKEKEKKALSKEMQEVAREQYLGEQLVKAFGRNGIPALIVENSLPDIEDIANDLLSRLTNGRMSVQLATQKETKTAGISETLDIIIADELGERPYEGWSGAEKFDTDIALRLAISKFLARRAGTKIETLVIDEGASCLDQQGRQKFIEAINTISEDFAKIICISHIDELKEAFPQQIHVRKTPDGSRVEVVA